MKLVLTVPALERLLGGDTDVEVEIRKSIVHEFSKRHLSAVAKEVFGDIEKVKEKVTQQVMTGIGVARVDRWSNSFQITSETQQMIKKLIADQLHVEIVKTTQQAWLELRPAIMQEMKNCYNREILRAMHEQVKKDILAALGQGAP